VLAHQGRLGGYGLEMQKNVGQRFEPPENHGGNIVLPPKNAMGDCPTYLGHLMVSLPGCERVQCLEQGVTPGARGQAGCWQMLAFRPRGYSRRAGASALRLEIAKVFRIVPLELY